MANEDKKYRVEAHCSECGEFLMGSNEKPHFTIEELHKAWTGLVISAPLNAPRCPKCKYATDRDYNAGLSYLIDDGETKVTSKEFWEKV